MSVLTEASFVGISLRSISRIECTRAASLVDARIAGSVWIIRPMIGKRKSAHVSGLTAKLIEIASSMDSTECQNPRGTYRTEPGPTTSDEGKLVGTSIVEQK